MDGIATHDGGVCSINWTNSFVEISSFLERNAREHDASLVMYTGWHGPASWEDTLAGAIPPAMWGDVRYSESNFVVNTLDGADTDKTGINPSSTNVSDYYDLPTNYVLGDNTIVRQSLPDTTYDLSNVLNFDEEYP